MSEKKINYCKTVRESKDKYFDYITNHKNNVINAYDTAIRAFKEIFPNVYEDCTDNYIMSIRITNHDSSKYSFEEFEPYRERFFPVEREDGSEPDEDEVKRNFELGWLHHVHNNPHHPEYWTLVDKGEIKIYDMPDICIIEMLCDWMAMSKYYNSTTLSWWQSESAKKLPMSERTKSKVNEFMDWMLKNNVHTLW